MKIGRNDLCPCGSGKKYKKCCLNKDKNINKTKEEKKEIANNLLDGLFNLRKFILRSKPHIKKYNKIRSLHGEILESMKTYIENDKYDYNEKINNIIDELQKELKCSYSSLISKFNIIADRDEMVIDELFMYNNHPNLVSITEEYLNKNKFRKEEKIKMLKAMNDSYLGIFKITNTNEEEAYVEIEDITNERKFKIVDMALSLDVYDNSKNLYFVRRIITYDNISFGTGLSFTFDKNDGFFNNYLKNYNKNKTNFTKIIEIYDINKVTGHKTKINNI